MKPAPKAKSAKAGAPARPLRLLLVEDSAADAELTAATLKRSGFALSCDVVDSREEYQEKLEKTEYDLIISDHNLITWTGMEALELLSRSGKSIPFIVLTATLGDEAAVDYIKQGATDYVLKHRLERVPIVVGRALKEKAQHDEALQLQEQISAGKREWELTFDTVPEVLLVLDGDGRVQRANRPASELLGTPIPQMLGKLCYELLHKNAGTVPSCPHERLLLSGQCESGELEESWLGKVFDMTSSPLHDPRGTLRGSVVVLRDITERKKAEVQLRLQAAALEAAANAILITSCKGEIIWANPAFTELTGYTLQEVLGKNPRMLKSNVHSQELYQGMWQTILAGHVWRGEMTNRRKDGTLYYEEMTITPVRDALGQTSHYIAIKQDVTERKRLDAHIRRLNDELEDRVQIRTAELARANAELDLRHKELERASKFKDQFLSTMSHELRTPLNAVMGFSELLSDAKYGPLNERQQRYIHHIHSGGKHLLRLINDVLDLSKIEAGRMELAIESVSAKTLCDDVVSSLGALAVKKSQSLSVDCEPSVAVRADGIRLKQILTNLLGNAIKFTPEGGQISMHARTEDQSVRLEVRDNGPGIPLDEQKRIFESFVRLPKSGKTAEGTGLGLAITQRLVALHGGQLGLESEPGKGSCFYFHLPSAAEPRERPVEETDEQPAQGERVLVIEDDAVSARLISVQLESEGFEVSVCDQPERAVAQAANFQPAAITLDVLMNPTMGWEVLTQLKNDPRTTAIPVIMVTVVDQPAVGATLGAEAYLIKPVEKHDLLAAVHGCLRKRHPKGETASILVVEDDAPTREMISELLKEAQFSVLTAADGAEARAAVAAALPHLVILDLVLPKVNGFDLLAEWRADPRTADLPVFVLTSKDLSAEEQEYLHASAKVLFHKQQPWKQTLLEQIRRATAQDRKKSQHPPLASR